MACERGSKTHRPVRPGTDIPPTCLDRSTSATCGKGDVGEVSEASIFLTTASIPDGLLLARRQTSRNPSMIAADAFVARQVYGRQGYVIIRSEQQRHQPFDRFRKTTPSWQGTCRSVFARKAPAHRYRRLGLNGVRQGTRTRRPGTDPLALRPRSVNHRRKPRWAGRHPSMDAGSRCRTDGGFPIRAAQ